MSTEQDYDAYTQEDFNVWNLLFSRQRRILESRAHPAYLNCINQLNSALNADYIPRFTELNQVLSKATGWTIEVVPGLIPVEKFFEFLSEKKFCSSTWLRPIDNLDYLEEPDMFHDIFGHVPLLMNREYSNFVQQMGRLGVRYKNEEEILKKLQRLYWFTIEFGVITYENQRKIYGAGIISSVKETKHIYNDVIEIIPYDLMHIMQEDFDISRIQNRYYLLESFGQLYDTISELDAIFEAYVSSN